MNNRGQTLLEAVIALAILVIILGAVATAVLTSVNNSSYIKQQNQANKLAQQGMEYIRDRINNSGDQRFAIYAGYTGSNQTQCLGDVSTTCPDPTTDCHLIPGVCTQANIQSIFKREVTFTKDACNNAGSDFTNGLKVEVNVYWTDGKCSSPFCHSQKVVSCFIDPAKSVPAGGSTEI